MLRRDMIVSAEHIQKEVQANIISADGSVSGVCFDYFDTIVTRSISPEFTKKIAAKQLVSLLGFELSQNALYEIRREVETALCNTNTAAGFDAEFSLYDLAARLHHILRLTGPHCSYLDREDDFIDLFADIEVTVECNVQTCREELVNLLRWLQANDIPAYLISDFYIPAKHFSKMLRHHGVDELFSELFISADFLYTKSSGQLYTTVADRLGCKPYQLLMIGDNEHSDHTTANDKGLTSFLLETEQQKSYYQSWEKNNRAHTTRDVRLVSELERAIKEHTTGHFPEMGVTLWNFIHKLFQQLVQDKVKNVFFCSKEGEFLKKLFIHYQQALFGKQVIASHYLLVSRKATFICSLSPISDESFQRLFDHYRDLSIEEFLLSLNFSPSQVDAICLEANVQKKGRKFNLKEDPAFHQLLDSDHFKELYETHRISQKNCFLEYLNSFDVPFLQEGLAMVDVGWKGSIQNNIGRALGNNVHLRGYYIGVLSPSDLNERNSKKGIVFSDYPEHSQYIHVYNNNRSLFEMLLGASHGSADGYFASDGLTAIMEEKGSCLYQHIEGQGGGVAVTALDLPEERDLYQSMIQPLQEMYLQIFTSATSLYATTEAGMPDSTWFAQKHSRMVFKPSDEEVDFYSDLYHLENFGLFEFTKFSQGDHLTLLQRLNNLKSLIKQPAQYLETGTWPPIILKRMGLGFLQSVDGAKRYRRIFKDSK